MKIKNRLFIIISLLMLLSLVVVTGCGENSSHPVTDDQLAEIYENARQALTWFHMSTMEVDWSAEGIQGEGYTFWLPVVHQTIHTLADLQAHLRQLFVEDFVNDLLFGDNVMYRDFDGVLHGFAADRGGNILAGEETHEIIRLDDDTIIYRVSVDIHVDTAWMDPPPAIDYVEVFDFYMVYENGNWLFSNFELVR